MYKWQIAFYGQTSRGSVEVVANSFKTAIAVFDDILGSDHEITSVIRGRYIRYGTQTSNTINTPTN